MKSLLCLHGLLPITFRGVAYNIPIACWIPLAYPKESPLAYVVPTGDMLVRSSASVEVSGLCQFDYLKQWVNKPEVRNSGFSSKVYFVDNKHILLCRDVMCADC